MVTLFKNPFPLAAESFCTVFFFSLSLTPHLPSGHWHQYVSSKGRIVGNSLLNQLCLLRKDCWIWKRDPRVVTWISHKAKFTANETCNICQGSSHMSLELCNAFHASCVVVVQNHGDTQTTVESSPDAAGYFGAWLWSVTQCLSHISHKASFQNSSHPNCGVPLFIAEVNPNNSLRIIRII